MGTSTSILNLLNNWDSVQTVISVHQGCCYLGNSPGASARPQQAGGRPPPPPLGVGWRGRAHRACGSIPCPLQDSEEGPPGVHHASPTPPGQRGRPSGCTPSLPRPLWYGDLPCPLQDGEEDPPGAHQASPCPLGPRAILISFSVGAPIASPSNAPAVHRHLALTHLRLKVQTHCVCAVSSC